MGKQREYVFRFQPRENSPDDILLNYIKSSEGANELALRAMRAYWQAYAYREASSKKGQALTKAARELIWILQSHIEELRVEFGIEVPPPVYTSSPPVAAAAASTMSLSNPEAEAKLQEEEQEKTAAAWKAMAQGTLDPGGL
ncbi:MAG TPA: hypothetical protein V6C95_21510 [Coleofasciculaceae cyanobacterium]